MLGVSQNRSFVRPGQVGFGQEADTV